MSENQMNNELVTPKFDHLLQLYPFAELMNVTHHLSELDFQLQQKKQMSQQIHGGSIGIVYTPLKKIVLVNRKNLHTGWALPGGMLEPNEDFPHGFVREMKEEIGISLNKIQLIMIEKKQFISPKNETLMFLLAVFSAPLPAIALPSPSAMDQSENLNASLFGSDQLPSPMILNDKHKIELFFKNFARNNHDLSI